MFRVITAVCTNWNSAAFGVRREWQPVPSKSPQHPEQIDKLFIKQMNEMKNNTYRIEE